MASLLNNASLLLNPAGSIISYQEDKIYSVLPKDGTGDFTFSGGDGGTRVNQQGYIETTPANLMTYSEAAADWDGNLFNNWLPTTVTSDSVIAPNGTLTADRLGDGYGRFNKSATAIPGQTYTYSVYLKNVSLSANFYVYVAWGLNGTLVSYATAGDQINVSTLSTTEWTRLIFTATAPSSGINQMQFGPCPFTGYGTNPSGQQLDVWGGMINIGSTAKPYQPTTDRLNYPRITYQNGRGALLSEPQRTNLLTYSQQFDNAAWDKPVATVTANTTISPDGTQNADTITCNGTGYQFVRQQPFSGTNQSCACTIYVKQGNTRYFALRNSGLTGNHDVWDFNSNAWVTNNTGATLSYEVLNNGWYRLISVNSNVNNFYFSFFPAGDASGVEVTTSSNLTVYAWGSQAEQNAPFASTYIPTTSATVTRPADSTNNTNTTNVASVVGQTEGVLYSDLYFEPNGTEKNYMYLNTNGSYNNGFLYLIGLTNNKLAVDIYNFPNTAQFSSQSPTLTAGRYKAAIAYKQNDFAFYLNGVQIGTDNSGTVPTLNRMYIGQGGDVAFSNGGPVFTTGFFPTRLTNTQLAELTTVRSGSGGNISYYGPYTIHTFTGSATFTPSFTGPVEVLVVAGGGGGGARHGGGGGAGGLLYVSSYGVSQGTGVTVTIGAGGPGVNPGAFGDCGINGSNSVFGGLTAIGGGGGGSYSNPVPTGGASGGGGGGGQNTSPGGSIAGQGNPGGTGGAGNGGGGGGGAGAVGSNAAGANTGGNGGNGLPYSITGYSTYYAGGGGGGSQPTQSNNPGGLGGGGTGDGQNQNGGAGVAYTGGGGGGTRSDNVFLIGGTGGSGIVIVRYLT